MSKIPSARQVNFYGWKLVTALFVVYLINTAFPYYGGTVLNAVMAEQLDFSRSSLGYGYSVFLVCVGLSAPAVGFYVNRYGVRASLTTGGALLVAGALLMGYATTKPWHYYVVFGVICGFGFSLGGVVPVQAAVTYWFARKKPLAMSIVLCASGIGAIASIPILNAVIEGAQGSWRSGWHVTAIACLISMATALLFVRSKPADLGQFPDGAENDGNVDETADHPAARHSVFQCTDAWALGDALRTRASAIIAVAASAYTMVFAMSMAHGVVHLKDQGLPESTAAITVSIIVSTSIAGRLLGGVLGYRLEPRYTWCGAMVFMTLGITVLSVASTPAQAYIYAAATGLGFGAAYVSMATIVGNYFGTQVFAPLLGVLVTVTGLVGALSPALSGIVYDDYGHYAPAFNTLIGISMVGTAILPFATPPIRGKATVPGENDAS